MEWKVDKLQLNKYMGSLLWRIAKKQFGQRIQQTGAVKKLEYICKRSVLQIKSAWIVFYR